MELDKKFPINLKEKDHRPPLLTNDFNIIAIALMRLKNRYNTHCPHKTKVKLSNSDTIPLKFKGLFGLRGVWKGVNYRVELAENNLIFSKLYSTLPLFPSI